ncbi:MAG: MerR family copper efflux transcriptional regulator [Candidatus Paceibacteria bacterium]|jgi:MerR family copper efflux transcriptional regulator
MNLTHDLLKIGDFARLAETNLRTLRYYEELGLLMPATRSTGGFRYYRPTDVNRVRLIWDLQQLGLPLERIAEQLGHRSERLPTKELAARLQQVLQDHDKLLEDRIELLKLQREKVSVARAKLEDCSRCRHLPSPDNNYCEPCKVSQDPLPDLLSALF